jgi:DNA-binding beta-propeller fold protein YncE
LRARTSRGITVALATGIVAVLAPVVAGGPAALAGHGAAYETADAAAAPVVDLAEGRGDARIQVTRDGRFGIVHQGSSYDPKLLHKVDLRTNRVTGSVSVPADTDSALAVRGNRFAYTIEGRNLWVTDISRAEPRRVRKVGFRVAGKRATLFDVVVAPNGRFAYVTADDWIHTPGSQVLVLALRTNGVPRLVRRVPVAATHLAISRDSARLVATDGPRIHLIDVRKPRRARRTGP